MKRRVLVVEDDVLIGMMLADMIEDLGHEAVGPARGVEEGLALARSEALDAAVLDVNLNGARSYPIAEELARRSIPFVFATGYGSDGVEDLPGGSPVLGKPYNPDDLSAALSKLLSAN